MFTTQLKTSLALSNIFSNWSFPVCHVDKIPLMDGSTKRKPLVELFSDVRAEQQAPGQRHSQTLALAVADATNGYFFFRQAADRSH